MKIHRIPVARLGLGHLLCSAAIPLLGLALLAPRAAAAVNHRPTISWIPDQRLANLDDDFSNQPFTVGDAETAELDLTVIVATSDSNWYPTTNISFSGTGATRTAILATPNGVGAATITLKVIDTAVNGQPAKSTSTSFTLRISNAGTAPVVQSVANQSLAKDSSTGLLTLVVKDDDISDPGLITLTSATSATTNSSLLPAGSIVFGDAEGRPESDPDYDPNRGRTVAVTPASGQTGRATVTITAADDGSPSLKTSTSFVVDVAGGTSPSFTVLPSHLVKAKGGAPSVSMNFTVTDTQTTASDLRVTATSSNAALVPNSGLVITGATGNRTITITPASPTATGASTITLTLSDGSLLSRKAFLFVVRDPAAAATQFSRSSGVFVLDGSNGTLYTTNFGRLILLRDANIRTLGFLNGFTLRVSWNDIERGGTPATAVGDGYDFKIIANAIDLLPAGQVLSVILTGPEPNYIVDASFNPGATTWTDEDGDLRAVPWDSYLRERRAVLVAAIADSTQTLDGVPLAVHPRLQVINTYLPGGHTGIRDPNFQVVGFRLQDLPGYTRQALLDTVREELMLIQDNFPGKLVQIGFWPVEDGEDAAHGGVHAHEWLRTNLLGEFDGTIRPLVGFFQENLAAKRPGANVDPYTGSPAGAGPEDIGTALFASRNATWTGFQMLGNWTIPFQDTHVDNTLNGAPNDAVEYGHNTYNSHYAEVYVDDIDNGAMQSALQSWHDYLGKFDTPTGLNALAKSGTTIDVKWDAVPTATSYSLQRQTGAGAYALVAGYNGTDVFFLDTGLTTGAVYGYRVRAAIPATAITPAGITSWSAPFHATAAAPTLTFFSIETEDGYVTASGNITNTGAGGVSAGESSVGDQRKGIVSFDTSALPDTATVAKATLRLKQRSQNGTPFTTLGDCMIDIESGNFGASVALAADDFSDNAGVAINVGTVLDVADEVWQDVTLSSTELSEVNKTGATQLRIYFNDADAPQNTVTWYSGENADNAPQLIVEYTLP